MPSRRNLTVLVGSLVLGLAVLFGAGPAETEASVAARDTGTRPVRVGFVEVSAGTREARLPGVTRSVSRAALSFTVAARVASRPVEVGDAVRAGQVLASLDAGAFALASRSAEAVLAELHVRLEQARRDEARAGQLAAARAATAEEVEKARAAAATLAAAHEAAAARLDDARRLLAETTLRSPFDGTVTAVKVEPGEWASAGATVVEVSGRDGVEVRLEVPEAIRARIAAGPALRVELPMSELSAAGRVVSVSDAAGGAGLFPVLVRLDAADGVVPGLAAEVVVPLSTPGELTVPLAAVLDSGSSRPAVFLVKGGAARRVEIRPGRVLGDRLAVRSDALAAGDAVAVLGHTALVDGDRVEVR